MPSCTHRSFDRGYDKTRSELRGSEQDYLAGNLLGQEVTADDVAQTFIDLALAKKTTGAVMTVDGGNVKLRDKPAKGAFR